MGCLQSSVENPPKNNATYCVSIGSNDDFVLTKTKTSKRNGKTITKTKKTPTSYLLYLPIYNPCVFIRMFVNMVNNKLYTKCSFNEYKDLFFCIDEVYSVENCKLSQYRHRQLLFKKVSKLKHKHFMLIPSDIYYIPLDDKEGIVIQKMEWCKHGDLLQIIYNKKAPKFDMMQVIHDMASTLLECHQNDIYLNDIKLENIFVDKNKQWKFADYEYAFYKRPYLPNVLTDVLSDFDKAKFKYATREFTWIRTLQYCPDRHFPLTRKDVARNDVFAFAKTFGMFTAARIYDFKANIFGDPEDRANGNRYQFALNYPDFWNVPCIKEMADCMYEYDEYANDQMLVKLIEITKTYL